jgi:hypothetical protein
LLLAAVAAAVLSMAQPAQAANVVIEGARWPAADMGQRWRIRYESCPHDVHALKKMRANMRSYAHGNSGLVGDLKALMGLALSCANDYDLFTGTLRAEMPEVLADAKRNLRSALGL